MNRLIRRRGDGTAICFFEGTIDQCTSEYACADCKHMMEIEKKLAAYEDTGLEPEEIQEAVNLFGCCDDVPKEIKRWVERCTWHVQKCSELRATLNKYEKAETIMPLSRGDVLALTAALHVINKRYASETFFVPNNTDIGRRYFKDCEFMRYEEIEKRLRRLTEMFMSATREEAEKALSND